jgi:hypothetical protein
VNVVTVDLDDAAAIRAQDPGGMLDAIAALGAHCRNGYANGAAATELPDPADVRSVVYCCDPRSGAGSGSRSR